MENGMKYVDIKQDILFLPKVVRNCHASTNNIEWTRNVFYIEFSNGIKFYIFHTKYVYKSFKYILYNLYV